MQVQYSPTYLGEVDWGRGSHSVLIINCLMLCVLISPTYLGEVDWYGGRGYVAELNQLDSNESMTVVSNLMSDGWLDRRLVG